MESEHEQEHEHELTATAAAVCVRTFFTTGSTHGLALSSR